MQNASQLSLLFAAALVASLLVKLWLATRQMRHVAQHRHEVPAAFRGVVGLEAHQKAADYTLARGRFGLLSMAFETTVLLGWTLLGGLDALNIAVRDAVLPLVSDRWAGMAYQLALLCAFGLISSLLDLPFELYRVFRLEAKFGFNRMTWRLYLKDALKMTGLTIAIGLPLAALILWVMARSGGLWWLWAWCVWTAFQLLAMLVYPIWIAPLFNKFEPLNDATLQARVQSLMQRCGFTAKGFFVMDGSLRSAHSNAYFTGLGRSKRVVFYDTLLASLTPEEMEAVLAHELGHFKYRHVLKRMLGLFALSLLALALLGWLAGQSWFYLGLGVQPNVGAAPNDALALLLLMLAVPVFGFFIAPLLAQFSRRDEFEADAYACAQADGRDLKNALLKLYDGNSSTLTPDPLYVRFYYSHPPASERLAAIEAKGAA
jgi:STE24 endopeptidase